MKLSPQVINDIKEYIGNRTSGYIFISTSNRNKNGGLTTTSLRRYIKSMFKQIGIDSDTFSLHSTRRSCGTFIYEQTNDIRKVQEVLHHKSMNTTNRYINAVSRKNNKSEYKS